MSTDVWAVVCVYTVRVDVLCVCSWKCWSAEGTGCFWSSSWRTQENFIRSQTSAGKTNTLLISARVCLWVVWFWSVMCGVFEMELETLREQMNLLRQQKHQLQEKLDDMRDYSELKRQTLEHQTQMRLIRHQLEEKHEENRRLTKGLSESIWRSWVTMILPQ